MLDIDDIDLIKEEKEDFFVVPGLVESLKVDKVSVKKEFVENEEIENCSLTNVWNNLIIFYDVFVDTVS